MTEPGQLPLSNGRLKQVAEWPLLKLAMSALVALATFLAGMIWNDIQTLKDGQQHTAVVIENHDVRIGVAERNIEALWRVRGGGL